MAVCSQCKKEFIPSEAREEFELEYPDMAYDNFNRSLCYECAHEIIDNCVDGYYFEECEQCEKKFDWFADNCTFMEMNSQYDNADLPTIKSYTNKILCADCASDYMHEEFPNGGGF